MLGGGVVGVEMAQAWASLGREVTLLEGGHRMLEREEPFASAAVQDGLVAPASTSAATRRSRG